MVVDHWFYHVERILEAMEITSCKTQEISNFLKNGKMIFWVKIKKISRSQMTKRTSPLESSCEI